MKTTSIVQGAIAPFFLALSLAASGCSAAPPSTDVVGSVSEGLSKCGATPHAPVCNLPRCTADGWSFAAMPAGAACKLPNGQSGTCNGGDGDDGIGACVGTPTKKGSLYPSYYVLTLLYSPPGIGSEVDYGAQSTIGSEVDIQNLVKAGVQIQAQGKIVGMGTTGQVGFAAGPIDGSSMEASKTQSSTLSLTAQVDALNHGTDTFYLWTNAEIDLSQATPTSPVLTSLASRGGAAPIVVPVSVNELRNQSLLAPWKQQALAALTPADYASLLTLDPLVPRASVVPIQVNAPPPDPARYNKITTLQLDGPDQPGDVETGMGIAVTNEQTNGQVIGKNNATTASIAFDSGFDLFGVLSAGVQVGFTYEYDYQKTTQSKQGSSETATVMLKTTTLGYHDTVDVYFDTLFNSFAFAHPSNGNVNRVSVIGAVAAKGGAAAGNERVVVTFANGEQRTVVTNSRGIYRVFDAPEGSATVQVGTHRERVVVPSDQPAKLDFDLGL